ncbi:MAG: molybdopterin-dependent oxidoreductase [Lautropia sp.]
MTSEQPETAATLVRAACPHDCPDTCALQVTVSAGRVTRIAGDPDHPTTHGALCTKVSRYAERTYSADRVLTPLRRSGPKGSGRFEPIGWDAALAEVAARLGAIAARDPQRILPYSYAGTMGMVQGESMAARFFNRLGSAQLERTICSAAGKTGLIHTLGAAVGMDVEHYAESELILLWGTNSITSNLHFWTFAQQAKRRGAKLIAIDPYRTATAEKCHQHIALLPGTDGALALGLIASLARQDLFDRDYIARHVLGFEPLLERARPWTAARVAATCGIDAAIVDQLAHDYATRRPAAIRLNYGMQRVRGGANAVRLIAGLPALVGAWRQRGGGMLLSSSGAFGIDWRTLQRPDLAPPAPRRTINMSAIGDALTTAEPPVEALVVYNSNPVAVAPDSNRVIAGFSREDLFTVVLEQFRTDTADYADIVLPATTQLEHVDIHPSYGHRYWVINEPAIAPLGSAQPNSEIFRRLARAMDFTDPCFSDSDWMLAAQAIDRTAASTPPALRADPDAAGPDAARPEAGDPEASDPDAGDPDLDTSGPVRSEQQALRRLAPLRVRGWLKLADASFANGGFPTPSGKVELYGSRLAAAGHDPLPDYLPPYESAATAPALAARFPLALITPPARHFLNSTFANVASLRAAEREQLAHLHPDDAAARALADGATVVVHNDRGSFRARLVVTDAARRGVVMAPGVWWHKHTDGGRNVNSVTHQRLTDLGNGPTFYDCLVDVRAA